MQEIYNRKSYSAQALDELPLDTVNIGADGDDFTAIDIGPKLAPPEQRQALFARFNAAPDAKFIYRGIIREWITSCYSAKHAVFSLRVCGLIADPYTGDPYDLMSRAAETEFPGVALPERVSAPIQPEYVNPDLVAALAPARTVGGAA
jgi:hypothetical protein